MALTITGEPDCMDAWAETFIKPEQPEGVTKCSSNVITPFWSTMGNGNGHESVTGVLEHISKLQTGHEQRIRHLFTEQQQNLLAALPPALQLSRDIDNREPLAPEVPVPNIGSFFGVHDPEQSLSPRSVTSSVASSPRVEAPVDGKNAAPLPLEDAPFLPHQPDSSCLFSVTKSEVAGVFDKQKAQLESLKAQSQKVNKNEKLKIAKEAVIRRSQPQAPGESPGVQEIRRSGTTNSMAFTFDEYVLEFVDSLVQHTSFELCVSGLVVFNAFIIGLQADWQVKHAEEQHIPAVFVILDMSCTVLFTLEILLRLYVERRWFFARSNSNFIWNALDSFIVMLSLFDEVVLVAFASQDNANVSFTRLFRTLRLARLLRMVKLVRFFNDLRVMCHGILHSMKSLLWALILLGLIMYVFSLCLLQFVAMRFADLPSDHPQVVELGKYFNSLMTTMRTLTMSITGGIDWADASTPLGQMHGMLELLYVFYVLFAILCVLNIVTGIFVETATKAYQEDESRLMLEDAKTRAKAIDTMRVIFEEADADSSGDVTFHEFRAIFHDPRLRYCFRKVGINLETESAEGLFKLLDFDGDDTVNLDEFVLALQHFGGPARSIDLVRIHYEFRKLRRDVLLLNSAGNIDISVSKKSAVTLAG